MKPGFKALLICFLGAFVLLGQVVLKNNQSIALFLNGQSSPVACELGDDPISDDTPHLAILVVRGLAPAISGQNVSGFFDTGIKPDFRNTHYFPDTRGSPAI
jgi:hypothetical protein